MINFLCKIFKLIQRQDLINYMCSKLYKMAMSKDALKKKCDTKEITEWIYYKKYWQLLGRLSMLEGLIIMIRRGN